MMMCDGTVNICVQCITICTMCAHTNNVSCKQFYIRTMLFSNIETPSAMSHWGGMGIKNRQARKLIYDLIVVDR